MPYIAKYVRESFAEDPHVPTNPGELNFAFTVLARAYLERHGEKYQTYNDIVGALESCKLELYRRRFAPYEDVKIQENGDLW